MTGPEPCVGVLWVPAVSPIAWRRTLVETHFSKSGETFNTFLQFQARSRGAAEWIVFTRGASATELLKNLPQAESARLEAASRSGSVVVTASVPYELNGHPFANWWQIDPEDGTTLGRGYRGWGTETTENLNTRTVATRETAPVARQTGKNTACKVLDAAVQVSMDYAAQWALAEANARAAGRGALIDKIRAADPGIYDDLPDWCK